MHLYMYIYEYYIFEKSIDHYYINFNAKYHALHIIFNNKYLFYILDTNKK